jgi:hypothetical protein
MVKILDAETRRESSSRVRRRGRGLADITCLTKGKEAASCFRELLPKKQKPKGEGQAALDSKRGVRLETHQLSRATQFFI